MVLDSFFRSMVPSGDSVADMKRRPSRISRMLSARLPLPSLTVNFAGQSDTTWIFGEAALVPVTKYTSTSWSPVATGVSPFSSFPSSRTFEAATPSTGTLILANPVAVRRNRTVAVCTFPGANFSVDRSVTLPASLPSLGKSSSTDAENSRPPASRADDI